MRARARWLHLAAMVCMGTGIVLLAIAVILLASRA